MKNDNTVTIKLAQVQTDELTQLSEIAGVTVDSLAQLAFDMGYDSMLFTAKLMAKRSHQNKNIQLDRLVRFADSLARQMDEARDGDFDLKAAAANLRYVLGSEIA